MLTAATSGLQQASSELPTNWLEADMRLWREEEVSSWGLGHGFSVERGTGFGLAAFL